MTQNFAAQEDDGAITFTLRLNDLSELFTAPEFDPFVEQLRTTSGVEDMVAHLSTRRLRNHTKALATLQLPPTAIQPDAAATAQAAMRRYCDAQIAGAQRAIATNTFNGRTKLPIGLIAAGLMFAALMASAWLLPPNLQPLLVLMAPVVTIASWAAIWNPVETLLYENWEERRTTQIHTCLREMEIRMAPSG